MKYKNNKEHPIDNLFAQKLGNLEGAPSENAWHALEKGLSQKTRKKNKAIVWLPYSAAAAIALLIVSVWLFRQQTTGSGNNTGLANNHQVESRKEQKTSATAPDMPATKDETNKLPENQVLDEQIAMQEKVDRKEGQEKSITSKPEGKAKQLTAPTMEKKSTIKPVVKEANSEKITKPAITPLENTVAQIEPEKQPSVIAPSSFAQDKEESTTIVVTVNLDEETEKLDEVEELVTEQTEEVQKKSRAGKLFSTLKKIKKGDFDELGIRPETIVAYVKDRASANNQSNEK